MESVKQYTSEHEEVTVTSGVDQYGQYRIYDATTQRLWIVNDEGERVSFSPDMILKEI